MPRRRKFRLRLPTRTLALGERTLLMGVVNVTPDSFSDGGLYLETDAAARHALALEQAGADILDIGGESTRPGAEPTPPEVELDRVVPVIQKLRGRVKIPISIDTRRAEVADMAARAGAEIINDVSALRDDPEMAEVAGRHKLPVILMHMRGTPKTMQKRPFARNVVRDVRAGLEAAIRRAVDGGLERRRLLIDPGIGFGKSFRQNFELLARLWEFADLGLPIVVGTSRKMFVGSAIGGAVAKERVWGTAATVTAAVLGGAHIVRVHDVREMVQVVKVADAMLDAGGRITREN
ncbi:MAG: dihydropteroate synthase [Acidobacteriota bacterium]|nr:dihydropteroate synthase [Acidobacteriota bacterium]